MEVLCQLIEPCGVSTGAAALMFLGPWPRGKADLAGVGTWSWG